MTSSGTMQALGATPEYIYAARINLAGLYSDKPLKCRWDENLQSWWGDNGNFEVETLGFVDENLMANFSSIEEHEVEIWIAGAMAVIKAVANWGGFK